MSVFRNRAGYQRDKYLSIEHMEKEKTIRFQIGEVSKFDDALDYQVTYKEAQDLITELKKFVDKEFTTFTEIKV